MCHSNLLLKFSVYIFWFYRECADYRAHNARPAKCQRQQHAFRCTEDDDAQHHRGGNCRNIGFIQVGAHAGHITDIVANIIGDNRRVARVVLGNALLHFAHQVSTDIRALGEDATARPQEQSYRRSTEGKSQPDMAVVPDKGDDGKAEQSQADDAEAHHRTAGEGDFQSPGPAPDGGIGRPGIGQGSDVHSQPARQCRGKRAAEVSNGDIWPRVNEYGQDNEDHHGEDGQGGEFAAQKGHRSLPNGLGNLPHFFIARALANNRPNQVANETESQHARQNNQYTQNQCVHMSDLLNYGALRKKEGSSATAFMNINSSFLACSLTLLV